MGFNRTFSGLPGESPEEYLEEVELFGERVAPNDEKVRQKEMNVAFRSGLRGPAKSNWYLKLAPEKRKYDKVQDLFKKRFKLRSSDLGQSIGAQVYNFNRKPDESVPEFIQRATELSYQCDDPQSRELMRRLYKSFQIL